MRGIVYSTVSERWGVVSKWVMSTGSKSDVEAGHAGTAVPIGPRLAASEHFTAIFKDGMALVERTAAYLDGDGRKQAKALGPAVALVYATESMRLTTRLLEIASWLLLQRSLKDGEMTADEARVKRRSIRFSALGRPSHTKGFSELPKALRDLIEESFALSDRVLQLDRALQGDRSTPAEVINPVGSNIALISAAFAGRNRGRRDAI